jgi:hypothetical protein
MKADDPITRQDSSSDLTEALHAARPASGLYVTHGTMLGHASTDADADLEASGPELIPALAGEELRLDVDGRYPQTTASGTITISPVQRLHWIAAIHATGSNTYTGGIWYKDPAVTPFGYTTVDIKVSSLLVLGRKAKVVFSGPGLKPRVRLFKFRSPYFHKVEVEYDSESPIVPVVQIDSCAHPNHPATLPCENLTIRQVFQRSGFETSISPNPSSIGGAPGGTWSDMEMHDAMIVFWSRFANLPQWALWTFFADQHDMGSGLGGIMFDDIGPNHRQGTAIFYDSFISDPPPIGDPNIAAYIARNRFWTAVHEMGHSFNLAHSWQKSLGAPYGSPWIPLADEPEARSFMNYPYGVSGGETAFYADFEYRFTDQELLFMRHAPERFVRMGDAAWFDHHGFEQARAMPAPPLSLDIRVNRPTPVFEFLEPVVVELKLMNISATPQVVDENILTTLDGITIALKRQGSPARQFLPFAQYCMKAAAKVLQPNEAMYASVYVTAGLNGVDVAEPGRYLLQAALHTPEGDIVSKPLTLRVATPRGMEEEVVAQDFFSDKVSRVLAFDGSRVLPQANQVLRDVVERLGDRRVARHARIPLGLSVAEPARVLAIGASAETATGTASAKKTIKMESAQPERAESELTAALMSHPDVAAESLGHVDYKVYVDDLTSLLEAQGKADEAADTQDTLYKIMAARNVLPGVLAEIDERRQALRTGSTARSNKKGRGKGN